MSKAVQLLNEYPVATPMALDSAGYYPKKLHLKAIRYSNLADKLGKTQKAYLTSSSKTRLSIISRLQDFWLHTQLFNVKEITVCYLTKTLSRLVFLSLLLCQGCSSVSPWERGNLAKEVMAINPSPHLNGFRDHIFTSKEASHGGHAGGAGGCGCN